MCRVSSKLGGLVSVTGLALAAVLHVDPPPTDGVFHLHGIVADFHRFDMGLALANRVVRVHLHQGTILVPRGLMLRRNASVEVAGFWILGRFEADRIWLVPQRSRRR